MLSGDVEKQYASETQPILHQGDYRPDVDGLRAFAVISVILYHMNPAWVPAGFAGVDIFFVISGFVVTSSLFGRDHKDGPTQFVLGFFVRRAKRLLPVLMLVILTSATLLAFVAPIWDQEMTPKFLKVGMAGVFGNANNWMVFGEVHDYWTQGDAAFNDYHPFLHLWSLGVEEQFYVIYPFVLLGAMGTSMSLNSGPSMSRHLNFLALLTMSSLTLAWILEETSMSLHAFYLLPSRFWELAFGCMLFPMCSGIRQVLLRDRVLARALEFVAGALLVVSVIFTKNGETSFPVPWGFLPTIAALCYIAVGTVSQDTLLNSGLGSKWPVYVGRLSYSMYLWHMPVLAIMQWVTVNGRDSILNCFVSGVLTLGLSIASFHLVEEPLRRVKGISSFHVLGMTLAVTGAVTLWIGLLMHARKMASEAEAEAWLMRALCLMCAVIATLFMEHLPWQRPLKLFIAGALLLVAVGVSETSIFIKAQNAAATVPGAGPGALVSLSSKVQLAAEESLSASCTCSKTLHQVKFPEFAATNADAPTCFEEQSVNAMSFLAFEAGHCFAAATRASDALIKNCLPHTDSRALYLITDLQTSSLWNAVSTASSGSGLQAFGISWEANLQGMESTVDQLKRVVKSGDIVAYAPHSAAFHSTEEYKTRIEALQQVSLRADAKLALFDAVPTLPSPSEVCALKQSNSACTISEDASLAQQKVMRDVLTSFVQKDGVAGLDLHELFCHEGRCNSLIPGTDTVAFADAVRLNQAGNQYLTPFICAFLGKVTG
mmetsp:Transcript_37501/g.67845  ORF Transcript_37501/g.67845 Transcript_37501/m.67845 type:complete len:771 (-) Transcript_37501:27-2339(-)|eukprot:CAMPEP_0197658348 /NCGR_PEP_ID=MMETSP1338-20131121/45180_1 /TAXON_ID=43686 ORGANISM="Pelagodinium beii, Strain RCC1491" /NCGR_SAMPLE_ID=MMETSP1338 /ASSEMBLY_ACC=CAM_ASM_000754 /LENGTH=770 /DNA_ID=CAMNT_0043234919 /DNA_START=48 /DNA_END=2360 /DNA_ORIENTATION=-